MGVSWSGVSLGGGGGGNITIEGGLLPGDQVKVDNLATNTSAQVVSLQEVDSTHNNLFATVSAQVVSLSATDASLSSRISGVSAHTSSLFSTNVTQSFVNAAVSGRIVALSGNVASLDVDIAAVSARVDTLNDTTDILSTQIAALSAQDITLNTYIATLSAQVESLEAGGAGVASWKGRTGAVVPVTGDISADLITDSGTRGVLLITQRAKLLTIQSSAEVNPINLDFLADGASRAAVSADKISYIANLPADTLAEIARVSAIAEAGGTGGASQPILLRTSFQPVTLVSAANMEPGTTNRIRANLANATRSGLEVTQGNTVGRASQRIKTQYTVDTNTSAASVWVNMGVEVSGETAFNTGVASPLVDIPTGAKLADGTWIRVYISGSPSFSASNTLKIMNFVTEVPAGRQGEDGAPGADGDPGTGLRGSWVVNITGNVENQIICANTDVPVTLASAYISVLGGAARFGFLRGNTTVIETKGAPANSWVLNGVSTTIPMNTITPQTLDAYDPISVRVTNASALTGFIFAVNGVPT